MPQASRHARQRCQKILVDRIVLAVDALLLRHLVFEPQALLDRVGEFAKTVGEFDAADVKLEALGDAWIARRPTRQRRLPGRVGLEDGGAADAELRLDALDQDAAENIAPAIVGGEADAGSRGGGGERLAVRLAAGQRRQQVDAGETLERRGDAQPFRRRERVGRAAAKAPLPRSGRLRRKRENGRAVVHQRRQRLAGPVPFDQGEFRMVQRAALAIAKNPGEFDDPALAGRQQLLAGKFRRGAQIKRRRRAVRRRQRGGKCVQMGLVPRRNLQCAGLDLDEVAGGEPGPQRRDDPPARQQERPAVGVNVGRPQRRRSRGDGHGGRGRRGGRGFGHILACGARTKYVAVGLKIAVLRAETAQPYVTTTFEEAVKVIASSLRKGNIVEIDGKLGVIAATENIHPGKGTPVTQMEVRRIADGVKLSLRFKTTEQVERAFVEDRKHQFMYQDADGFHFMNMESYDQVAVPADIVGDLAAYLQPEMEVTISLHEGTPVAIELPPRATLEVVDTF